MGCNVSKSTIDPSRPVSRRARSINAEGEMNLSQHGGTQRQLLAQFRDNVELTEYYDIIQTIGRGSMGEVYIVEKKPGLTREPASRNNLAAMNPIQEVPNSPFPTTPSSTRLAFTPQAPPLETAISPTSSPIATKTKKTRQYACKTVSTLLMKPHEIKEFINEVLILRNLDHPNIIQLYEVFQFKKKIWIVTELCRGGDLTSRIHQMNEEDVAVVVEQIVRAVAYMHSQNVCHRDIKLENIMYASKDEDSPIKLIDFGLSNQFTRGVKMLQACGTAYTAAPEILLKEGYTEKSDIWSIGVVTYVLLSQTYPFLKDLNDLEDAQKKDNLQNAKVTFGPEWERRNISSVAKEFVCMCLKKDPEQRLSATRAVQFVQNSWIPFLEDQRKILENGISDSGLVKCLSTNNLMEKITDVTTASSTQTSGSFDQFTKLTVTTDRKTDENPRQEPRKGRSALQNTAAYAKKRMKMKSAHLDSMSNFALYGNLKKTILMTMVYTMDKSRLVRLRPFVYLFNCIEYSFLSRHLPLCNSLQELAQLFSAMDEDNEGTITLLDLKEALKRMGSDKHLDDRTIEKLFNGIDVDKSGLIHYHEFLAAVIESLGLVTVDNLADAFNRMDTDGKGYISKEDLKKLLGTDYNEKLVDKMIREADKKRNGQVHYDEFLRLMFDDPAKGYHNIFDLPKELFHSVVGKKKKKTKVTAM